MALICSVIRFLQNFKTGIFRTLLGKLPGSDATPMGIKEPSQAHIPVRTRRAQFIEVEFLDHASDQCAVVFEKEKEGRLACAIVHERGKNPSFWRALPVIASDLAIDLMKRPCETVRWVLMSYAIESSGEFSFEVWEALLSLDDDGSLKVSWSEARPEYAAEWIRRVQATMELVPRISIRPLAGNERLRAA
jgi:hypothetical protein